MGRRNAAANKTANENRSVRLTRLRSKLAGAPKVMRGLDDNNRATEVLPPDPENIPVDEVCKRLPQSHPQCRRKIRIILRTNPKPKIRLILRRTSKKIVSLILRRSKPKGIDLRPSRRDPPSSDGAADADIKHQTAAREDASPGESPTLTNDEPDGDQATDHLSGVPQTPSSEWPSSIKLEPKDGHASSVSDRTPSMPSGLPSWTMFEPDGEDLFTNNLSGNSGARPCNIVLPGIQRLLDQPNHLYFREINWSSVNEAPGVGSFLGRKRQRPDDDEDELEGKTGKRRRLYDSTADDLGSDPSPRQCLRPILQEAERVES